MKIITRGAVPDTQKPVRAKCDHCKTVFEFKPAEATLVADRDGDFYSILCPVCEKPVNKHAL